MSDKRVCVVRTAQMWFDSARKAQSEGKMSEALMYMENAFNHTENALSALLQVTSFKNQPPVSGQPKRTLAQLRDELDAMREQRVNG